MNSKLNEDIIYPEYIDNKNFRYVIVDNKVIASLKIYEFPKYFKFLEIMRNIEMVKNITHFDMAMYIEKQDSKQILKELTYNIAVSKSEKNTVASNQIDIDVLSNLEENAKDIRYEIQVNNEEIFKTNCIITIYLDVNINDNYKIIDILRNIESMLYSKGIYTNHMNFRQLEAYVATLPLNILSKNIQTTNYLFTTTSLTHMYPFFSDNIFDTNGVILGYDANLNNMYNINIFSDRYLNANICIFGASGSGKSFFTKLNILRNYYNNTKQVVFDIEGEYINISKSLNTEVIDLVNGGYMNILDINKNDLIHTLNFLDNKIQSVKKYITKEILSDFKDMESIDILMDNIREEYIKCGINNDIESIYMKNINNKIAIHKKIKCGRNMPCMLDVFKKIKNCTKISKKARVDIEKIYEIFQNKVPYFLNHTNIDFSSPCIVINLSNMSTKNIINVSKYILNYININILGEDNTIIYFDEAWKYINNSENIENSLQLDIYTLYKTIRKRKGSIVTITQDIYDFFKFNNGNYGKSVINNSNFKIFFKLNFTDIEFLEKIGVLNNEISSQIKYLNKGQAIVIFNNSYIKINIKSSKTEESIIKGAINDNYSG